MGTLDGKVIIISGAGRGIGRAIALGLAERGATVVVNDRGVDGGGDGTDGGPATAVAEEIAAAGGTAVADHGDIADAAAVEALVAGAVARFGRLDAVVNSAGILRDRMVFSMDDDDWDAVMAVHLRGHFLLTRTACRYWRAQSKELGAPVSGAVVSLSSEAGLYGNVGQANYSAAKGGIASFAMVIAREMQRYGVTSNVIAPRARTRMTEGAFGEFARSGGAHPWDPENVVPTVAFLLSDEGHSYTGQILVTGGGVLQKIAHYTVAAEIATGAEPPADDDVGAFLADAVGADGGPPPFPDLGLAG